MNNILFENFLLSKFRRFKYDRKRPWRTDYASQCLLQVTCQKKHYCSCL